jgi:APA family basic amino acid/polyamine antiporter
MDTPPPPRRFGYWTAHFVVASSMIGAGVLTTSGYTLQATGNPTALLALWVIGGLMAVCGAVTIAELATRLPHAGGDYIYVREGFGRGAGFVAGWATFVVGFCGPTAVIAHLAVTYLTAPFSAHLAAALPDWLFPAVVPAGATLLIAGVSIAHCLGHRESGLYQIGVTAFTVSLMLVLGAGGLLFGSGDWSHLKAGHWPTSQQWPPLATGLIYVCYAYAGWNGAGYIAGEMKSPERLLPPALVFGTLSVVGVYVLVNLAYVYALNPAEMTARPEGDPEVEKVAELAVVKLFGREAANVFAVLLGMSLLAAASAYTLTGPRVTFALARDGLFPPFAGRLHPTRGVPVAATIAQGVVAAAFVWSGSFVKLLDYVSVGLTAVSGLVVASVFPLRRRSAPTAYRMPLYPLPPILYLALVGWTVASQVIDPDKRVGALLSLGTVLVGLPLGRLFRASRGP